MKKQILTMMAIAMAAATLTGCGEKKETVYDNPFVEEFVKNNPELVNGNSDADKTESKEAEQEAAEAEEEFEWWINPENSIEVSSDVLTDENGEKIFSVPITVNMPYAEGLVTMVKEEHTDTLASVTYTSPRTAINSETKFRIQAENIDEKALTGDINVYERGEGFYVCEEIGNWKLYYPTGIGYGNTTTDICWEIRLYDTDHMKVFKIYTVAYFKRDDYKARMADEEAHIARFVEDIKNCIQ